MRTSFFHLLRQRTRVKMRFHTTVYNLPTSSVEGLCDRPTDRAVVSRFLIVGPRLTPPGRTTDPACAGHRGSANERPPARFRWTTLLLPALSATFGDSRASRVTSPWFYSRGFQGPSMRETRADFRGKDFTILSRTNPAVRCASVSLSLGGGPGLRPKNEPSHLFRKQRFYISQ